MHCLARPFMASPAPLIKSGHQDLLALSTPPIPPLDTGRDAASQAGQVVIMWDPFLHNNVHSKAPQHRYTTPTANTPAQVHYPHSKHPSTGTLPPQQSTPAQVHYPHSKAPQHRYTTPTAKHPSTGANALGPSGVQTPGQVLMY